MIPFGGSKKLSFPENPSCHQVQSREKLNGKIPECVNPVSILIVDDSIDCRMILRTAMEAEGYCCEEASDGRAALTLCQALSIDFIVTDFQMPHMNGCEFLEELSRVAIRPPPSVMITGNLTEALRTRAMHAGALAVFSKPFDQKRILTMVREIVNRKPEAHCWKGSLSHSEIQ